MIIFINEERPYLSWLARHRDGFVLDFLRKPTKRQAILHRAVCPEVKHSRTKQTHWTTGRHTKACSLDREELENWAKDELRQGLERCATCWPMPSVPGAEHGASGAACGRLTKLGMEILDCVLELAVLRLDGGAPDYSLTAGDVAELLGKSPAQLTSAFQRLLTGGYLTTERNAAPGADIPADCTVYPTTKALRTLPAFEQMKSSVIEKERRGLYDVES